VEAGATLAQCVIGAGQVIAPGVTLRQRVFLGHLEAGAPGLPIVPSPEIADGMAPEGWETPPLGPSGEMPLRPAYVAVKRAADAIVAATGLLLFAPLGLLIAALIKLESRGPIHFGHVREGMGGRPFRCWKYRTMIPGADQQQRKLSQMNQMDGPQFKVARDPRRTRMGRFLSATNLDEVPQLWNVLVGEMSLVGPRPSPFRENQVCVPWREGRLSVRPGITGLWQICRHDRHKGDFHQWIYYDLLYVRHLSLWLDLKILALTPLSFMRSGYIPLRWLLAPAQYGERRSARRQAEASAASKSTSGGS
jgi:lipopolysaccharide/colanic/teichoic acid biosynthesis glycosyltransferase